MTPRSKILTLLLSMLALTARPDNAPVTTAGAITNATTGPGAVHVPITVNNFVSIGCFTLTLRYRSDLSTYVSTASNPVFTGMTVSSTIDGVIGKLVFTWPQTPGGVTLPDGAHLLDLTFTYLSGTTPLAWGYNVDLGLVCEYKKFSCGSYILLNDSPEESYYINGGISNRSAPVTTVPSFANIVSGNQVIVPVTVTGFNTIGACYLQMEYDSTVLTYTSLTPNPSMGGGFTYGVANGSGTKKIITVGWYGSSLTLANGSILYTVRFTYHNTAGKSNYSALTLIDTGPSCEYADAAGHVLIDFPYDNYYHNGLVYSQYAAKVWLPQFIGVVNNSTMSLLLKTTGFSNISSFNLSFEYDTTAMTYSGFTANASFGGTITVTNNPSSGNRRKLAISWPGTSPLTLADSTTLVTLNVTHKTGSTILAWVTSDASSCRFNDAIGNAYYDFPKMSFYQKGLVAGQAAPLTVAWSAAATIGQLVTVPVRVFNFENIGVFNLTLDYDPGVLVYQGDALQAPIDGTYSSSTEGAGRLIMQWTGTAGSLADSTVLINLSFIYNGGEPALIWYDNGSSCRYAAGTNAPDLYDQPKTQFYVNGYIKPSLIDANFTAGCLLPLVNQAVIFTDLSSGNPTSWQWIINPPVAQFVNGTSASSQNPQMRFTVNGAYTITLVAAKDSATGLKVRSEYIHAGIPGLWTGASSADWYTGSNWDNYLVPCGTVSVTIPTVSAGKHYPQVTGDLITTSNCFNITLIGQSVLTIDGLFTINPGTTLNIGGTGTVIAGN